MFQESTKKKSADIQNRGAPATQVNISFSFLVCVYDISQKACMVGGTGSWSCGTDHIRGLILVPQSCTSHHTYGVAVTHALRREAPTALYKRRRPRR